ncbi:MAG: VOC family protein [Paracoccaceae bacterium]
MADDFHGLPCWYELSTTDPGAAEGFYEGVLGWAWSKADLPDFDYRIARVGEAMVAGMMKGEAGGPPPMWTIYYAVRDIDATVAAMATDGAKPIVPPTDIPATGRFSILLDPQGAAFGLLQPLPGGSGGAFDQQKTGHGNWHELMTGDVAAALAFYGRHLGWTASSTMDMGPGGTYQLFARAGQDIGGMMALQPGMPVPFWLPYFGADGVEKAMAEIAASGGANKMGPQEVPGGAVIAVAADPQGAAFAVVGPK